METDIQTPQANETPVESTENAAPVEQVPTESAPAPEWKPDFKFKVMDKEHEIDPLFHSVIKDEETLKKVKRLHEQALGIPHLEQSREEFKAKYNQIMPKVQEYETVAKSLDRLSYFVQNKDFGSFFDQLRIPKEEVFKWVRQEVEMSEASPQAKADREAALALSRQKFDLENELNYYREQNMLTQRQQQLATIDNTIKEAAGELANEYNTRMSDPMAFMNYVVRKGAEIQQTTGQSMPPQAVIELVAKEISQLMGFNPNQSQQGTVQNQVVPAAAQKPPVIPVVKAGGASPIKQAPKSIDDLKKLAAQM